MADMAANPSAAGYQRAPLGIRFVAAIIDWLIAIGIGVVFGIIAAILGGGAIGNLIQLISTLISLYIFGWGVGETGFSPGTRAQGAMVLSTSTNQPIGGVMGLARYVLTVIFFFLCLADIIALVATGRRITDRILNTDVYHVQPGSITPIFPNGTPF